VARPVLDQINIVSANMRESIAFYRLLGVDVPEPPLSKSGEPFHVNGDAGDTGLDLDSDSFARVWNAAWRDKSDLGGRVVIGFGLESREAVDEVYEKLTRAGHKGLQPPWDAFWGARYAIVEDPNAIAVGLMSPRDPARNYWPPEGWSG
jgi:catechol 2,3-dioxygenase-like lactoylglutathione lyase family enzyme